MQKKHAETRWVSLKYVALRCLEQWPNLKEYFLTYLPRQKNFKHDIQNTQRYTRIKTALTNPLMEAYVAFCAFIAHDFESFLIPFQTSEPMVHLLHPSLCNLLFKLQRKFIRKNKLSSDLSENIYIDVNNVKNVKPSDQIDVGTKALSMFSTNNQFFSPPGSKRTQNSQTGAFFKNQPIVWFLVTISGIKTIANTKLPPFPKRAWLMW